VLSTRVDEVTWGHGDKGRCVDATQSRPYQQIEGISWQVGMVTRGEHWLVGEVRMW